MNNYKRKKLGLSKKDYVDDIKKSEAKITELTPISLEQNIKDYNAYSKLNIKTINIGTLKKPIEKLVVFDNETQGYYPIQIIDKNTNPPYYFSQSSQNISLNGEVFNYKTTVSVDQNNPYDPLFSSFSRLSSFDANVSIDGSVTGITQGDQQRFFTLTSGFSKTESIEVKNAGTFLNGVFIPSGFLNNRTRYLNSNLLKHAEIIWSVSPTGWFLKQRQSKSSFDSFYFLPGDNFLPTGNNWESTGISSATGLFPLPTSNQFDIEGFFKIPTTRISKNKNKIYAKITGGDGLLIGSTIQELPESYSWATYPHSYNVQHFPALKYDSFLTFNSNEKINDILIVSTGISSKKIIYISPHSIQNFGGFWSETVASTRLPKIVNGKTISTRPVYQLKSGNLISVSSTDYNSPKFEPYISNDTGFYDINSTMLKQETPINNTMYYKLYEPIYKKDTFHTGVWNGIIPSGVPFSIETIRTKNAEISTPIINLYLLNSFVDSISSGSGSYQYIQPGYSSGIQSCQSCAYSEIKKLPFFGYGQFDGVKIKYSYNNTYEAKYFAEKTAYKQAASKLYGYLWDKGLLEGNSKSKKMMNLMNRKNVENVTLSGSTAGYGFYCQNNLNVSDPLSCSYTGTNILPLGFKTRGGIRLPDNTLISNIDASGNFIDWKKNTDY